MLRHDELDEMEVQEQAEERGNFGLLGLVWRRKWIILFVTAIGVGLGYLVYTQQPPMYASTAQILLIKKDRGNMPIKGVEGSTSYQDTLSTHMLLITSPMIVGRAVEDHDLDSLRSLQFVRDPVGAILQGLSVSRAGGRDFPDPNVIELSFEGSDARDCATILEAIVATYQDYLGETYQDFSKETVDLITQAKDVLHKQLTEKETAYRRFRQESPLLWKGSEAQNLHEKRMQDIETTRATILVKNSEIKAEVDAIERAVQQGGNSEALKLLVGEERGKEAVDRSAFHSFRQELFQLLAEEAALLEDYGPDHPKVQSVRKRMDLLRETLKSEDAGSNDYIGVYLGSLRERLAIGEQRVRELNALFEREREAAKQLATYQIEDETFTNDIDRLKLLFSGVIKRLEEINLVKDVGGIKTRLITVPGIGSQTKPDLAVIMTLATVLGLLAGSGLGYLVDLADRRFRSPEEIRRELGLPIVGHIPVIDANKKSEMINGEAEKRLHPMLCTYFQPKGRTSEAYRAVRTSLYFSGVGDGHKVVQVTSPHPGDGKTTMAANLAISIANSGKKVLLMEADFRRPRVHTMFGGGNSVGVSSVIAGEAEIPEVTRQTAIENLWIVPCGPRPHNPAELLTSPKFKELLDVLREEFDFVVIDSPPLLAVTDASVVAPRVDGVLLVMRLTKNARDGARRATEILNTMGAKVLGVVVNGIGRGSSYGYGRVYGYGTYSYAYYKGRYGYGYQDYDEEYVDTYYDADEELAEQHSNGRP